MRIPVLASAFFFIFVQKRANTMVLSFLQPKEKRSEDSCLQGGEYQIFSLTNQEQPQFEHVFEVCLIG